MCISNRLLLTLVAVLLAGLVSVACGKTVVEEPQAQSGVPAGQPEPPGSRRPGPPRRVSQLPGSWPSSPQRLSSLPPRPQVLRRQGALPSRRAVCRPPIPWPR